MTQTRSQITKKLPSFLLGLALLGGASAYAQTAPTPAEPPDGGGMPAPPPEEVAPPEAEARIMMPPPEDPTPPPAPAATGSIDYDKGLVFKVVNDKGDFEMHFKLRIESLWDLTSKVVADDRTTDARFSVARARLELEGHAFTKKLNYKFQSDFGKGFLALKDFWFEGQVADKVWLRSGQWKRPYSRQQMTSSGKLEMTSRAITDAAFRGSRDIGIALHNGYEASPEGLEWIVGVFNGTTDKATFSGGTADPMTGGVTGGSFSNVPKAWMPAFIGRVGWNHGGIKGYSESDLEGGPLRYAIGLSVYGETDFDRDSKRTHQAELDGIVKINGLAATAALYALATDDLSTADADSKQLGFHLQVGKVIGKGTRRMEPSARFAMVIPSGKKPVHEILVGFGWLPWGHNCKVLFDVGTVFDTEADQGPGDNLLAQVGFDAGFF